jgi:predicted Zn-dependent protease
VLAARPASAAAWDQLGLVFFRQARWPDAEAAFREGLRHEPRSVALRGNLALALAQQGKTGDADATYQSMTADEPKWRADAIVWALRLATHPSRGQRDGARAWELAQQACQASHDEDPAALEARAAAEAELGRFDRAVADAERALARTAPGSELRSRLAAELETLRQHRPLRAAEQ